MSVKQARQEIDSAEFSEWMAYYQLEPFGEERADLRNAQLCCLYANSKTKKGKRYKLKDFMPRFEKESPEDRNKRIRATLMAFAAAQNRMVKQRGNRSKHKRKPNRENQ